MIETDIFRLHFLTVVDVSLHDALISKKSLEENKGKRYNEHLRIKDEERHGGPKRTDTDSWKNNVGKRKGKGSEIKVEKRREKKEERESQT